MRTINHVNVEQYYDLHKEVLGEFDLGNHPEKIYNMDESAISLNPHPPKLAAQKGEICVLWKEESDNNWVVPQDSQFPHLSFLMRSSLTPCG